MWQLTAFEQLLKTYKSLTKKDKEKAIKTFGDISTTNANEFKEWYRSGYRDAIADMNKPATKGE